MTDQNKSLPVLLGDLEKRVRGTIDGLVEERSQLISAGELAIQSYNKIEGELIKKSQEYTKLLKEKTDLSEQYQILFIKKHDTKLHLRQQQASYNKLRKGYNVLNKKYVRLQERAPQVEESGSDLELKLKESQEKISSLETERSTYKATLKLIYHHLGMSDSPTVENVVQRIKTVMSENKGDMEQSSHTVYIERVITPLNPSPSLPNKTSYLYEQHKPSHQTPQKPEGVADNDPSQNYKQPMLPMFTGLAIAGIAVCGMYFLVGNSINTINKDEVFVDASLSGATNKQNFDASVTQFVLDLSSVPVRETLPPLSVIENKLLLPDMGTPNISSVSISSPVPVSAAPVLNTYSAVTPPINYINPQTTVPVKKGLTKSTIPKPVTKKKNWISGCGDPRASPEFIARDSWSDYSCKVVPKADESACIIGYKYIPTPHDKKNGYSFVSDEGKNNYLYPCYSPELCCPKGINIISEVKPVINDVQIPNKTVVEEKPNPIPSTPPPKRIDVPNTIPNTPTGPSTPPLENTHLPINPNTIPVNAKTNDPVTNAIPSTPISGGAP